MVASSRTTTLAKMEERRRCREIYREGREMSVTAGKLGRVMADVNGWWHGGVGENGLRCIAR